MILPRRASPASNGSEASCGKPPTMAETPAEQVDSVHRRRRIGAAFRAGGAVTALSSTQAGLSRALFDDGAAVRMVELDALDCARVTTSARMDERDLFRPGGELRHGLTRGLRSSAAAQVQ